MHGGGKLWRIYCRTANPDLPGALLEFLPRRVAVKWLVYAFRKAENPIYE